MIAIYAPGGGRGHRARAHAIAARFPSGAARIFGDGDVPGEGDTLIVDTFPSGRRGEITDAVRARFRRCILVRRYVRPGSLDTVRDPANAHESPVRPPDGRDSAVRESADARESNVRSPDGRDSAGRGSADPRESNVRSPDVRESAGRESADARESNVRSPDGRDSAGRGPADERGYRVWLPYDRGADEWDGAVAGTYVGPLVRRLRIEDGPEAAVAVLGDVARIPWRVAWPADTRFVAAWEDAIPRGARYVVVGAGHNTVYELRALGVRFAAYPLDRRYDDQHRRAARLGVGAWTPDELARFLA